jgi:hypothetical protein
MNWIPIVSTVISVIIYAGLLWFIGWLFGITKFIKIIKAGKFEFRKWAGWFSFLAFIIALFVQLHDRAVAFIERLLIVLAGNNTQPYFLNENLLITLIVSLTYLLLDFLLLAILVEKR